jgi:hypothetical protein
MNSSDTIIPSVSEGEFSEEEWRELTEPLRRTEQVFRRLALESNFRVLSSARWPELRLKKQGGWTSTEIRLTLHPGHARSRPDRSRWVVNLVRYPRFAWLPFGQSSVTTIAVLADDELRPGGRVEDCIQNTVRSLPSKVSTVF